MLTYKSYYNYLCELISRKDSSVNIRWEPIITNLLCHQLVRIVQTLFLSVHSFMLLQANGTHWVNILERQILIPPGIVLKQCYLHNNMYADWKQHLYIIVISVVSTVNYCGCIVIIIYSSIALIYSSVRTCSVRCLEIAYVQEQEN